MNHPNRYSRVFEYDYELFGNENRAMDEFEEFQNICDGQYETDPYMLEADSDDFGYADR